MFEERAQPVSEDVMYKWRLLVEDGCRAGHTYSQPDLIIAGTALHRGLTVVTRDMADFERARVPGLNPWTDAPGSRVRVPAPLHGSAQLECDADKERFEAKLKRIVKAKPKSESEK